MKKISSLENFSTADSFIHKCLHIKAYSLDSVVPCYLAKATQQLELIATHPKRKSSLALVPHVPVSSLKIYYVESPLKVFK